MRARPALSLSEIAGAAPLALASFLAIGPQLAAATEANDGSVLPFPPTPSASVAAPTLQDSTMVRRAEPNYLSKDAPENPHHLARRRWLRTARHVWRANSHAHTLAPRKPRHQLQRLPHYLHLLADPRRLAHRTQPSARRFWNHRRTRGGLGWLYGRYPQDFCDPPESIGLLRL